MSQEEVLVVDDEEVMRDVLGRVLGQAGYSVSFAETGPEGVELVVVNGRVAWDGSAGERAGRALRGER